MGVGYRPVGSPSNWFGNEVGKQLLDFKRRLEFAMHHLFPNVLGGYFDEK